MNNQELSVWVAISKNNTLLLFSEEPKRSSDDVNFEWVGNLYLNSMIYEQIERMIKQSDMKHTSDPEQLIFTIKSTK